MGGSTKKTADSASRQERKAKKRKLEDAIPDVPGEDNDSDDGAARVNGGEREIQEGRELKRVKKSDEKKKGKKEKNSTIPMGEKQEQEEGLDAGNDKPATSSIARDILGEEEEQQAPRKSKKERKAERKAQLATEKQQQQKSDPSSSREIEKDSVQATATTAETERGNDAKKMQKVKKSSGRDGDGQTKTQRNNQRRDQKRAEKREAAGGGAGGEQRDSRFIVFVGNLPFSATTESITKHFAAVKPKSVRHLTQKHEPTRSKGCAFVEFEGYDHMKTALRLFHHSTFEDGLSPGRKINVELTAGGGGNTKDRKSKIQEKNAKLNEERARKIHEEEKARSERKVNGDDAGADQSGIHPSRRMRVHA